MEVPEPEQSVATGGVYTAFKAGHRSLFKRGRQPKTWDSQSHILCLDSLFPTEGSQTCRMIVASGIAHWTTHTCPSSGAGQYRAKAVSLTCLGACEILPGCHRAASLPGEPHLTDSFQPPALPASVTTGWREETRYNT